MKAVVFHRPRHVSVDQVDDPKILQPTDAIVRVTLTAICGSDLHIYNGMFPQLKRFVLGHEILGVVEDVGRDVTRLQKGDRVVVPYSVSCGSCFFCMRALYPHCERSNSDHYGPDGGVLRDKGGGVLGYTDLYGGYQGGQAEAVRVPFADVGPRKVPEDLTDEQALFLSDILPTGWTAVEWARLEGGETVAVFGCGPVGLMAQKAAWIKGAGRVIGVDIEEYRLETAARVAKSETVHAGRHDPVKTIRAMTDGRGADVCIDAVGMEAHRSVLKKLSNVVHAEVGSIDVLESCLRAVRRGGVVPVVGVYGINYDDFPLGKMFDKGLTVRLGLAPVHRYIDELSAMIHDGRLRADDIITHRLPLDEAARAYDLFNRKKDGCVKVVMRP